MSAKTDTAAGPARRPAQPWGLMGLLWGGVNLLALAAGLFPRLLSAGSTDPFPPRTLQTLAVAQVKFLLLAYPCALIWRQGRVPPQDMPYPAGPQHRMPVLAGVFEIVLWLALAAPFWAAAAYFADATLQDACRTAGLVAGMFLPAWGIALLARHGDVTRGVALLLPGLLGVGTLWALYLLLEFAGQAPQWLREVTPASLAWQVAQARQEHWEPRPTWAFALYPLIGIALMLVHAALAGRSRRAAEPQ